MKNSRIKKMKPPAEADTGRLHTEPEAESLWRDPFVHILIILAVGFAGYFGSASVPFMFDDFSCIVTNPAIQSFDCFPSTGKVFDYAIAPDIRNNFYLRPFAYFTFALNYALHGFHLFGYHLVNLLLHIACGMLLYRLLVQLMSSPAMAVSVKPDAITSHPDDARHLSLFAALLFISHPLQTQAVTYIVQRFVPLATFFYLAALVLYAEFRRTSTLARRSTSYVLSLAAAVLAMESKEIAFTLPAVLVLVEFLFHRGKTMNRIIMVAPFLLTMAIIPVKLMQLPSPTRPADSESVSRAMNLVNFGGIPPGDYLMSQFGVITTYIRLMFLPVGQTLDHDYPLKTNFFAADVLLPLSMLLLILGTGLYLLKRSQENGLFKITAFGIFWFFITLSVESSIVPIEDLLFEHRAYLPSIGFFIAILAGGAALFSRLTGASVARSKRATLLLVSVVVVLSATTVARNMIWQDEVAFWKDAVEKTPGKGRPHRWLGLALMRKSKQLENGKSGENSPLRPESNKVLQEAVETLKEAIRLEPQVPMGHRLLAEALMSQKKFDEALHSLSTSTELEPANPLQYVLRGEIFERRGDTERARHEYLEALRVDPAAHLAHLQLGNLHAKEGNVVEAVKQYESLLRIYPDEGVRKKLNNLRNGLPATYR